MDIDMICSPPSKMLCQLHKIWITSPLSLNVIWFFVFELMVGTVQTNGQTDGI